ncbi:MAG TPA: tRNA (adenosine(37)-N6)-threonylcarbamoyltransferase complex dimerization subunit type 1 TsaB [Actinomycetes bacterium]|nr:tRNA (adenosine(37)-N6)-threonylcarbamoyltransferase complex dimerization subunit type 1 TsaB [Actinomycetes bacterium]
MLLALDTATPAVTVAVADGERVLAESTTVDARRHGELLAPAIEGVLREAGVDRRDLTRIGVGVGPGPFTGLRIGLVTARTLGAVLGLEVLGVCSLDVLALGSGLTGDYRVVTDARRREVHWAAYDGSDPARPVRTEGPYVATPADAAYAGPAVGAGAHLYLDSFPGHRQPLLPTAADLARWVARGLPTTAPDPLYLRRPDVAEPGVRKSVL